MKHGVTMTNSEILRYLSKVQEEYDKKHPRKPGEWIEDEDRNTDAFVAAVRLGGEMRRARQAQTM